MSRKQWSPKEKLEVVRALLSGKESAAEICRRHGCALTQAQKWREEAERGMLAALADKRLKSSRDPKEDRIASLERALGRFASANESLKKMLGEDDR